MLDNAKLLEILNKHIGTPQLHHAILGDYQGVYNLGIGKSWNGEYSIIISIPKEVEQIFPEFITLDNVKFPIVSDYALKSISIFD